MFALIRQSLVIAVLIVVSLGSAFAEDVPSIEQIVQEGQAVHERLRDDSGEDNQFWFGCLARAQVAQGKKENALQWAMKIPSGYRDIVLLICADIFVDRTKSPLVLAPNVFTDHLGYETYQFETAKSLLKTGSIDGAHQLLPDEDDSLRSRVHYLDYYVSGATILADRGDSEQAERFLQKAWAILPLRINGKVLGRPKQIIQFVSTALSVGQRKWALAARDLLHRRLTVQLDQLKRSSLTPRLASTSFSARYLVGLAKINSLLGEQSRSLHDFQRAFSAVRIVLKSHGTIEDRPNERAVRESADVILEIAATQHQCGFRDESRANFVLVAAHARYLADISRESLLKLLVLQLARAGEFEMVASQFSRMENYWKALTLLELSDIYDEKGFQSGSELAHKSAIQLISKERSTETKISLLMDLADRSTDRQEAKQLLDEAICWSIADPQNGMRQAIARCQIRVGLLQDA